MHTLESPKDFVHTKSLRYLCIQSQKCVVHTFYFLRTSSPNPFVKSMSTVVASNVFGCPKTDKLPLAFRPYNPKSVTKHKAPIGGCRSTPLWKRKKRELFSSLFSLSLRQSLGHTSVFSERDGDCLCSGRRKECCYLLPRTQHSFLHLAGSP